MIYLKDLHGVAHQHVRLPEHKDSNSPVVQRNNRLFHCLNILAAQNPKDNAYNSSDDSHMYNESNLLTPDFLLFTPR